MLYYIGKKELFLKDNKLPKQLNDTLPADVNLKQQLVYFAEEKPKKFFFYFCKFI